MKKENIFKQSAKELKNTKVLVMTAMLIAIYIILYVFCSIRVSESLEIRFQSAVLGIIGYLFGPVVGGISGGVGDILKLAIKPTGSIIIGMTISEVLRGVLYGVCFYKSKVTFLRVLITVTISSVVINMLLNTFWLSSYLGTSFLGLFSVRAVKELIMLPIQVAIYYTLLKTFTKVKILDKI